MNLGKNVYNLLKRQSEVYIKGLGSFKRNHTPATYDEKRAVYLPPISYIDFDQTSNRGYDFIQYIAQLNAVDIHEAEQQVNPVVHDLLQKIREEGQAKLDDLGYLVSYGEGYVFKALDLSGFHYEPVSAETPVTPKTTVAVPKVAIPQEKPEEKQIDELPKVPVVAEEEQPVSAEFMEPFFENKIRTQRSGSNTIWYILIAVVALGIVGGLYYYSTKQAIRASEPLVTVDSSATAQDTASMVVPQDTASLAQDSLAKTLADTTTTLTETRPAAPILTKVENWQIVIGSHKTLEQAYQHAAEFNKKGYPNVRVIPSNMAKNRKKVIWDTYETKAQLDSALQFVQKNINKDAWPDKIN